MLILLGWTPSIKIKFETLQFCKILVVLVTFSIDQKYKKLMRIKIYNKKYVRHKSLTKLMVETKNKNRSISMSEDSFWSLTIVL
jgi:hypothetical protein